MRLHRTVLLLTGAIAPALSLAQTPPVVGVTASGDLAAYDVVSIKPFPPDGRIIIGVRPTADGFVANSATVFHLMREAYGGLLNLATDESVSGLPNWAKTDYFAVQAKMSAEQVAEFSKLSRDEKANQRKGMLQALLADRFKLKAHYETKQVPDYELTLMKGGPKFTEGDTPNGQKDKNGNPIVGTFLRITGQVGNYQMQAYSMESLAMFLTAPVAGVGRIVQDKTGLTGKYTFALSFVPVLPSQPEPVGEAQAPDSRPSISLSCGRVFATRERLPATHNSFLFVVKAPNLCKSRHTPRSKRDQKFPKMAFEFHSTWYT